MALSGHAEAEAERLVATKNSEALATAANVRAEWHMPAGIIWKDRPKVRPNSLQTPLQVLQTAEATQPKLET